jgi:hypothetical protein
MNSGVSISELHPVERKSSRPFPIIVTLSRGGPGLVQATISRRVSSSPADGCVRPPGLTYQPIGQPKLLTTLADGVTTVVYLAKG